MKMIIRKSVGWGQSYYSSEKQVSLTCLSSTASYCSSWSNSWGSDWCDGMCWSDGGCYSETGAPMDYSGASSCFGFRQSF